MFLKKSQVALEFLMTYGWAILVVLVAIGALAYFGVLSPDKFLPNKCTLSSGIACLDHKADLTLNEVTVVIQNSLGYDISLISVSASDCTDDSTPAGLVNGAKGTYVMTSCTFASTSKYSGDVNVSYTNTGTSITHKNQGRIVTKIE